MTPLEAIIRRQIAQTGPMPLKDYMTLCLAHPEHGYYKTRDPLGAAGDFTTAPEISQMFGELIGLALAQAWLDQGRPSPFILAEIGPGRGTLMADALRATRGVPGFHDAASIWLIETSPALRAEQAKRVQGAQWADRLDAVPSGPLFLIANEFFDALPVSHFLMSGGKWREKVVCVEGDRLSYGLRPAQQSLGPAPEGAMREICPLLSVIGRDISARIAAYGGAGLVIDYGYADAGVMGGDTVQAMKNHAFVDVLDTPGEADLTAHVDFAALAAAIRAGGAVPEGPVDQGLFLSHLGIGARAEALCRAAPEQSGAIDAALTRLTGSDEMGTLFKVLAIHPARTPPPPGCET